jgi:hypothetical protein
MRNLPNYADFIVSHNLTIAKRRLLETIQIYSKPEESIIIGIILESNLINEFYNNDVEILNEESFKEKLAKKVGSIKKTIKEKGKSALSDTQEKIMKIGSNVKSYVSVIIKTVKKQIEKILGIIKTAAKKAVESSDKIKEKVKENEGKKEFVGEIKNFKEMYGGAVKWFKSGFVKDLEESMTKKATNETLELHVYETLIEGIQSHEITIDSLLEEDTKGKPKIPFFSKLVDGIRKIPPIKQLWDFGLYAEKVANNALHKASVFLNKAAGTSGPHKFPKLGMMVGLGLEVLARKPLELGLIALVPALGIIVTTIKSVEMAAFIMSLAG